MNKKRVLVIATGDVATEVVETLRGSGYSVWRSRDAVDGLKKLRRASPDLVIIDRSIARVNREDACSHIRRASYVPIIVLGCDDDPTEVLESGADVCMPKPPDLEELAARVHSLLRRRTKGVRLMVNFQDANENNHNPNEWDPSRP